MLKARECPTGDTLYGVALRLGTLAPIMLYHRMCESGSGWLWRRRQLSITFVLVPNKLLDEPFWIRESNQMATPNYVYIGFQA